MKRKFIIILLFSMIPMSACQASTDLPSVTGTQGIEFTLTPAQSAAVANTELSVRLIGVAGDSRCPSGVECVVSGSVSISLAVRLGNADPANIDLQTFTDNTGRAPDMQFEGIKDRELYQGYLIRVRWVLPYPASPLKKIKDSEYRVTLIVTEQ